MKNPKVIIALSGGIDSAVAAFLLQEEGFQVEGAIMNIHDPSLDLDLAGADACFSREKTKDLGDARRVAGRLDVPLHVVDLQKTFRKNILDFFISQYRAGRTPNPCVRCNHLIKFSALPRELKKMGLPFDFFATGHYVRLDSDPVSGQPVLKMAVDPLKDQSYFLSLLSRDLLATLRFPLGALYKREVWKIARRVFPFLTEKQESQDFISGGYQRLFTGIARTGPILSIGGKKIGTHPGIENFTVGQRRGIGIAADRPLYVIEKKPDRNALIVGHKEDLLTPSLLAGDLNWLLSFPGKKPFRCQVRIRYNSPAVDARVIPVPGNIARVEFDHPQESVTPGQACVFYRDDTVLGGGTIQ